MSSQSDHKPLLDFVVRRLYFRDGMLLKQRVCLVIPFYGKWFQVPTRQNIKSRLSLPAMVAANYCIPRYAAGIYLNLIYSPVRVCFIPTVAKPTLPSPKDLNSCSQRIRYMCTIQTVTRAILATMLWRLMLSLSLPLVAAQAQEVSSTVYITNDGDLHLSSELNRSVLLNGVNVVTRVESLERENEQLSLQVATMTQILDATCQASFARSLTPKLFASSSSAVSSFAHPAFSQAGFVLATAVASEKNKSILKRRAETSRW